MSIRRTRLVSGLILLTYLATHFINHALGLISLEAMEAGRAWFLALWRNPLGTTALYYQRYHLRMSPWEALQLVLGLTIPLFLTAHVIGTRVAHEWFDVNDSYAIIVLSLWGVTPANGGRPIFVINEVPALRWSRGSTGTRS
jgi:adenylate cyclase